MGSTSRPSGWRPISTGSTSETTGSTTRTSSRRSRSRTRGRTTRRPSRAGTGTSGGRRSTTPAARSPRHLRSPSPSPSREESPYLPRDELRQEPVRVQRTGDREQRRSQWRPSQPHRPGLSREGLGRHHPALPVHRQERPAADLPRLQLEPRGSGDLAEQMRAAASAGSADAEADHADPRVRREPWERQAPGPLRVQQPEPDDHRAPGDRRTASRRRRTIAGSRTHSPRVGSRTPSRPNWAEAP